MRENENPASVIKLPPASRWYCREAHQLQHLIINNLDGDEQKIRQLLTLLTDNVGTQVRQSPGNSPLHIIDDAARYRQARDAAVHIVDLDVHAPTIVFLAAGDGCQFNARATDLHPLGQRLAGL